MAISAQQVKELRDQTGAGMMECKRALQESSGDLEKAVKVLRERGLAAADKKTSRSTDEGLIGQYIHAGGKLGVLVEVNCETDFVARTDDYQALVKDIAMHIAAAAPRVVRREDLSEELVNSEREILQAQAEKTGKPPAVAEKFVEERMKKFFSEVCLYEQPFIKSPDQTVEEYVKSVIATIKENISVRRFARFKVGE